MKKYEQATRKTRKNLFDAFWQLYLTNDISKITVKKICEIANCDRTTFYRYFTDISDILFQIQDEILDTLKSKIKNKDSKLSFISPDGFKRFSDLFGKYIIVFYEKGDKRFYKKFKDLMIDEVYNLLDFSIDSIEKKEFLYEFLFSSLIISYSYWYRHQDILDFDSYVTLLDKVLFQGSKIIIGFLN